jgi:hypothetical protein
MEMEDEEGWFAMNKAKCKQNQTKSNKQNQNYYI